MSLSMFGLINISFGGVEEKCHIGPQAVKPCHLNDLFKAHQEITQLDLSNNNICSENLHNLFDCINLLRNLTELVLEKNYKLCDEGRSFPSFKLFLGNLLKCESLKKLNFSSCDLTWRAILAIVQTLKSSCSISSLNLSGDNRFEPDDEDENEAFRLFANNLAKIKCLEYLNISMIFPYQSESCEAFFLALCNVFTQIKIQSLNFSGNRLTSQAVLTLASTLCEDTSISLKKIFLVNTGISEEEKKILLQKGAIANIEIVL